MTEQDWDAVPEGVDEGRDRALRPALLSEFIGQRGLLDNLGTYVSGARGRGEALDHVLLYGPPGLGKTTLAHILAREMGVAIRQTSGPVLERKGDLTALLTDLNRGDVLFIDEIHRLKTSLEEMLYKAMEDFQIDLIIGQGVGARSMTIGIQPFTLVGATTRAGMLSAPLRDRFGILAHLDFYASVDLEEVVRRSARLLGIPMTEDAVREVAGRSRGTPRVVNKLVRRLRDFAEVHGDGRVTVDVAVAAFKALGVDEKGFDQNDHRYLRTLVQTFRGGPVGLSTLATALSEEKDTLEDLVEPYLVQQGFVRITSRGRVATPSALRHLGARPHEVGPLFAASGEEGRS